ncbi:MAG: CRISPR-associated endonuclease Cas2, partial [Desulfurella sp.]
MYIIGVYDICTTDEKGQARLAKIMKVFRKYLHHTQKSVFEGELSEAKFKSLIIETTKIINNSEDY